MIIWSQSSNLKYIYWNHLFPLSHILIIEFLRVPLNCPIWIWWQQFRGFCLLFFYNFQLILFYFKHLSSYIQPPAICPELSLLVKKNRRWSELMLFSKLRWWRCQGNGDSSNCSIDWIWSSCWVLTKYRHSETADYKRGGSRDQN